MSGACWQVAAVTGAQLIGRWLQLKDSANLGRITPAELDRALTAEWLRFIAAALAARARQGR